MGLLTWLVTTVLYLIRFIITLGIGLLTWLVKTVLYLIGFKASGPAGGSLAAKIQSACYGGTVPKGSLFARAQSRARAAHP